MIVCSIQWSESRTLQQELSTVLGYSMDGRQGLHGQSDDTWHEDYHLLMQLHNRGSAYFLSVSEAWQARTAP